MPVRVPLAELLERERLEPDVGAGVVAAAAGALLALVVVEQAGERAAGGVVEVQEGFSCLTIGVPVPRTTAGRG
jgi:hypothetical protein